MRTDRKVHTKTLMHHFKRDGTRKRLEKKIRNQTSSSSVPFENDTEDDQLQRMSDSDSDCHVMEHSDNHAEATKKATFVSA